MEQRSREMLESTVQSLRNEGMLRGPVTVALDKTLFPFYGKHACMLGRIYSKFTKGTKVFEAYATAQCVDMKCRSSWPPGWSKGACFWTKSCATCWKIWIATGSRCAACWSTGSFST